VYIIFRSCYLAEQGT